MSTVTRDHTGSLVDAHASPPLVHPTPLLEDEPSGPRGEADFDLDSGEEGGSDDENADLLDIGAPDGMPEALREGNDDDDTPFDDGGHAEPAFEDAGSDSDESGPAEPADAFGDDGLPATNDDGGAEGLLDGSESELDEASLPAVDADADGDFELSDMLAELGFGGDEPWDVVAGLSSDVSLSCASACDGLVVLAGAAALVLDRGDQTLRVHELDEPAWACVASDAATSRVFLGTGRGIEVLGAGAGPELLSSEHGVSQLVMAAGQLFALAHGNVWRVDAASGARQLQKEGVTSVGAAQGSLFATTSAGQLELLRGHDGHFQPIAIADSERLQIERGATIAACCSKTLLLFAEQRLIQFFLGDETRVRTLEIAQPVAAAACGASGFLVLAADGDALRLYTVIDHGSPMEVTRLTTTGWDGQTALAWDSTRDVAFVAGRAGLVALRPRLTH